MCKLFIQEKATIKTSKGLERWLSQSVKLLKHEDLVPARIHIKLWGQWYICSPRTGKTKSLTPGPSERPSCFKNQGMEPKDNLWPLHTHSNTSKSWTQVE